MDDGCALMHRGATISDVRQPRRALGCKCRNARAIGAALQKWAAHYRKGPTHGLQTGPARAVHVTVLYQFRWPIRALLAARGCLRAVRAVTAGTVELMQALGLVVDEAGHQRARPVTCASIAPVIVRPVGAGTTIESRCCRR